MISICIVVSKRIDQIRLGTDSIVAPKILYLKIVNIFLPISLNICFGCSKETKNHLIKMVLLKTHNILIHFGREI